MSPDVEVEDAERFSDHEHAINSSQETVPTLEISTPEFAGVLIQSRTCRL